MEGCENLARRVVVNIKTYADPRRDSKDREPIHFSLLIPLCYRHHHIHGFAWTRKPWPSRYHNPPERCRMVDCTEVGRRVEIHTNHYAGPGKRKRRRLVVKVLLCPAHQYVHGYAWTKNPYPLRFYGTFWEDYQEFRQPEKLAAGR
jgi:hypothetical protein